MCRHRFVRDRNFHSLSHAKFPVRLDHGFESIFMVWLRSQPDAVKAGAGGGTVGMDIIRRALARAGNGNRRTRIVERTAENAVGLREVTVSAHRRPTDPHVPVRYRDPDH